MALNDVVKFYQLTKNDYDNIDVKNLNAIYFLKDTQQIFLGDSEYTKTMGRLLAVPVSGDIGVGTEGENGKLYYYLGNKSIYLCETAETSIPHFSWTLVSTSLSESDVENIIEPFKLQVSESSEGNIVISSLGISPVVYTTVASTTETKTYTYDGNNTATGIVFATSSNGKNAFVKAGEYPNGTLNLTNQEMKGIVTNNSWLNWETTITSSMLDTTNSNATIINYQNQQREERAITRAVIVKTAGAYTITYNQFEDVITFPSSGIYLADLRDIGSDDYTSYLSIEMSTSSGGSDDSPVVDNPISYKGKEIEVFTKGICIGDSITEGNFNHSGGMITLNKYAYPRVLEKISGISISNAGISGVTSAEWLAAANNSSTYWGTWDEKSEWKWQTSTSAISLDGFDFAIIHLGINDCLNSVDVNTFGTSLQSIISKLQTAVSGIKIFICTITPAYSKANSAMASFNEKIKSIVSGYSSNIYLVDLAEYSECVPGSDYANTHLTAIGYSKMAQELYSIISYTIKQNSTKFKDVQFIGTSYTL